MILLAVIAFILLQAWVTIDLIYIVIHDGIKPSFSRHFFAAAYVLLGWTVISVLTRPEVVDSIIHGGGS